MKHNNLTLKYRPENGKYSTRDIYTRHAMQLLLRDKTLDTTSSPCQGRFKFSTLYRIGEKGMEEVLDWRRFQVISEIMFFLAGASIIRGWKYGLGRAGHLRALKYPSSETPVTINWNATNKRAKEDNVPITFANMIFYPAKEYAAVKWIKSTTFLPARFFNSKNVGYTRYKTSMKDRFIHALFTDPNVKANYKPAPNYK